jgi:hypothetical protein
VGWGGLCMVVVVGDDQPCEVMFAAFFVSKPGGFDRETGERCNGCHAAPMHITFGSARAVHPGTGCAALLTDMETDVSGIKNLNGVQIHRFANVVNRSHIGTGDLMLDRMKIYRAFIQR